MSNKTSDENVDSIEDDVRILFNLKCYLESLLASGQDKIYYNDLLYDEKTIDCINAIEDLLKEREKYTIKEEGKKQCMEGGWESEYKETNRKANRIIKKNK